MTEKGLVYELRLPIDIVCHPGGGLDVHFVIIELPQGVLVKSAPPQKVDCWPILANNMTFHRVTRTIELANAPLPHFTLPTEATVDGEELGNLPASYMESVYDVVAHPYLGEVVGTEQTPDTKLVSRMICSDGAPPVAVADPMGNITYKCRDGSTPTVVQETVFSTVQHPLRLPHFNETTGPAEGQIARVSVRAHEVWSNIPLVAIGCCGGSSSTGTGTGTGTSTPTLDPTSTLSPP